MYSEGILNLQCYKEKRKHLDIAMRIAPKHAASPHMAKSSTYAVFHRGSRLEDTGFLPRHRFGVESIFVPASI